MSTPFAIRDVVLEPAVTAELRRWCARAGGDPYAADQADYDAALSGALDELPRQMRSVADWFRDHLGAAGVTRLRGLPIPGNLAPTPNTSPPGAPIPTGTEALVLGAGALIGRVLALKQWCGGDRVHNVYPPPADAMAPLPDDVTTRRGSEGAHLAMHTEGALNPQVPEALIFLCLRSGALRPPTGFCDLRVGWENLDAAERSALREPSFGFSGRHRDGSSFITDPRPIATPYNGGLRFHYVDSLAGLDDRHERVMRRLRDAIAQTTVEITLSPGDLLFVDNTHMVHGGMPIVPRYDGTDRWLQRCLIRGLRPHSDNG